MSFCEQIYAGPILGFGMNGQAGSSLVVLGVLSRLMKQAAQEGRKLRAIYAMDADCCRPLGVLLQRTADELGIETVGVREVSLREHRRAVDASSFCWFGPDPDISPYVQDELELFEKFRPSLVIAFLRPSLGYSRAVYEQRVGRPLPYMGMGCSLIAGPGAYGVPANYFPAFAAPLMCRLVTSNTVTSFLTRKVYGRKIAQAARQLYVGFQKCRLPEKIMPLCFPDALFGDLPLISSSPLLSPNRPANSRILGLVDIRPRLSEEQELRQTAVLAQLKQWRSQGMRVIFISMGSTGHSFSQVLKATASMARDETQRVRILASTTVVENTSHTFMDALARDSLLAHSDWMHVGKVMPFVDLLITHGGVNSIESGILAGVPIVVAVPQQSEQGFNGLAVQSANLGAVVWEHMLGHMTEVAGGILGDMDSYKNRIRQYRSDQEACYDIEQQGQQLVDACNHVLQGAEEV